MRIHEPHVRRRGLTAVAVLVCLLIVTMISGALLKLGVAGREEVRAQEKRIQAEWLAQSGLDRALHRLAERPGYEGERWTLSASDLGVVASGQAPAAVVEIAVAKPAGAANRRLIQVHADYPPDPPRRARHSLELLVDLGSLKTGASR